MKIASSFTQINGDDYQWMRVKERDYVPESASLMHAKVVDPLRQGE